MVRTTPGPPSVIIRFLGNELRIPLVGVGAHEAYLAICSDDHLENRFEPFPRPRWEPNAEACSLLAISPPRSRCAALTDRHRGYGCLPADSQRRHDR
ncbi:TniB family NTP-binding protein [Micromonospora sp. WMMD998]|nr:TniB family NTP-binding protein [Micromonospora sp. WMMD998]WFE40927.1 TniB family NTP-binding protein [Micromonospora sp. WMMD998]